MSCTTDNYDKGQGKYSLMQAELVELSVNGNKEATSFMLDDGTQYTFVLPTIAKWIERLQIPSIVPSYIIIR